MSFAGALDKSETDEMLNVILQSRADKNLNVSVGMHGDFPNCKARHIVQRSSRSLGNGLEGRCASGLRTLVICTPIAKEKTNRTLGPEYSRKIIDSE